MQMTKQRKMLIGVLCLGVSGLAVDRLFLAAPSSASADDSDVIVEVPAPVTPTPADQTDAASMSDDGKALPSYASLTKRLVVAQQSQSIVAKADRIDPFDLPQQWQSERSTPTFETEQPMQDAEHRLTAVFQLDGTVRSVIDGNEEIMAVISGGGLDGRAIRVGQKIRVTKRNGEHEDFRLIEVGSRYVVWVSEQTEKSVEMKVAEVL